MNSSQDQSNLFKQKRDEYLVEIRKKKISDHLQAKRIKLALASEETQQNGNTNQISISIPDLASSFINFFKEENLSALYETAKEIRQAVSIDDHPPIEELISTGVMTYIMTFLKNGFNQSIDLAIECLWISANVASHKTESVKYLVDLDVIPIAFQLLEHENQDVKENVVWILANIAGEAKSYRTALLKKGLASKIDAILSSDQEQRIVRSTVWLMSNLCRGKPYPEFGEVASFLSYLEYFIKNSTDEELIENCMCTLCSFTDTEDEQQLKEIVDMDIYDQLFNMVSQGNNKIKGYAVKIIGNIVYNTDEFTEDLVEKNLIRFLLPVLDEPVKHIRKDACWTFSNILACSASEVSKVFEFESGKIIKKLFQMALTEDKEIAKDCLYALTNSCTTSDQLEEIDFLVSEGLLEMLIEVFKNSNDKEMIESCLGALEKVLDEGAEFKENPYYIKLQEIDGISVLEKLQTYASDDMFKSIETILDQYNSIHS